MTLFQPHFSAEGQSCADMQKNKLNNVFIYVRLYVTFLSYDSEYEYQVLERMERKRKEETEK